MENNAEEIRKWCEMIVGREVTLMLPSGVHTSGVLVDVKDSGAHVMSGNLDMRIPFSVISRALTNKHGINLIHLV